MNRYAMHTLMLVTLALLASLVLMVSATKSEARESGLTLTAQCSFSSISTRGLAN